jgi:hypothetical protein
MKKIIIGLVMIGAFTSCTSKVDRSEELLDPDKLLALKAESDSIQAEDLKRKKELIITQDINYIDNASLTSSSYFSTSRNVVTEIEFNLGKIDRLQSLVLKYEALKLDSIKKIASKKLKVIKKKLSYKMPSYRKQWTKLANDEVWESNMAVTSYKKSVTVICADFASNSSIQYSHNTLLSTFKVLGFTRANYKWYKGESEYTYYRINK